MLNEILETAREAWSAGRWDEALARYEAAIPVAVEQAGAAEVADIFQNIGNLHRERGGLELAADAYEVSLAIAEASRLAVAACSARAGLAAIEYHRGSLRAAEALYLDVREEAEALHQPQLIAMIDQDLGSIANIRGDVEGAIWRYNGALQHFESAGDALSMAGVLTNLGMTYVDLADWAAAEACCDRAFELYGRIHCESGLAETHKWYGVIYRDSGSDVLAGTHLRASVEAARGCGDRRLEAEALAEWAVVHLNAQRNREALQCLNNAHRIFADMHARRELVDLDRRLDQLEETYLLVVRAWGESIESKDRYTTGHCERVANYACLLAKAVGIGGRDLTWLRMGGYLHDVGKISVPAEVLNKAGSLSAEEWRQIQRHTMDGDEIVAGLNFPWDIRPVVRSHHERWDGYGYPDGLAGETIPLTARIVCLADVYDALTTTRSYRAAFPPEEALRIMDSEVGRIFDPELFGLFRSLILGRMPRAERRFPIPARRASAA